MEDTHKQSIVVAVSGGFDPIHIGHIRMLKNAKKLGDRLVVILNNDYWLIQKKGVAFIAEEERVEIVKAISYVDDVIVTHHPHEKNDMSICPELEALRPDIFANGGDRFLDNIPEAEICEQIGCEMVFDVGEGGKVQSSSWLLEKYASYHAGIS